MGAFRTLLDDMRTTLKRVDGLVESPAPFEALDLSDTMTVPVQRMAYALDLQSSDTGDERQGARMRIEHIARVQLLVRLQQHGRWAATMGEALDTEQDVIAALLTVKNLQGYRVRYLASTRELAGSGAYLLISMQFSAVGTVATGRD